ncbi:hypothetical protein ACFVGN_18035 [Streptomyces sp. NPDC057757]|uniref:hypothetical protein n=1 Tax=Streptomyces sp. NPDC057757 TaxID=3346241 RepID=UPI0036BCD547
MSNQPYEPRYEGHDPYQQPPQHQQPPPQPDWQQHTQQWEGQTWETQTHAPVTSADTAYLPPQGYQQAYGEPQGHGYGEPQGQGYAEPQGRSYGQGHPEPQGQGYGESRGQTFGQGRPEPQGQGYGEPQAYGYAAAPAPQPLPPQTAGTEGWARAPQPPEEPEGYAPAAVDGPGYGPPTITGNARVTDAQRARAEGRSPIIEPGIQPAALTALLGLLLSGTAAVGEYALVVPLVLLQAVTAAGWFRLNGMWPARQGIALAFAGALTADVVLLVAGRENAPAAILGTLGVWVLLTLVLQLRSHADADTRMSGLMATVASAALAIVAAGYLAAEPDAVSVGAVAVAVAVLARALPLPTAASVVVALLAATGAGIAVGGMTDIGTSGAFIGLGAGVCALIGHRVASYDYPSRFVHFTAGVALPLATAAPAVYLLGRAFG